ncbi:MAG: formyltransferase family protein [Armatimonadota bacterium]|nr:formyltransferase family protein [Armatimonadota bacterium]
MRLVVATTDDDPLAGEFWGAYRRAGGPPPAAVMFLARRRRAPAWRVVVEGLLLFGLRGGVRAWRLRRQARSVLRHAPQRVFAGVGAFYRVASLNRGEGLAILGRIKPDLLVSAGSPEVFKPHVLSLPTIGSVNVHNGRLPAYRGLFGTFWEALRGEVWGYACVHAMSPDVDAGPVLAQGPVRMDGCGLWEVLAAKKRLGGGLLAWVVRFAQDTGHLPPPCPLNDSLVPGYYGWPRLGDILRLWLARRLARLGQTPGRRARAQPWPADLAGDVHA